VSKQPSLFDPEPDPPAQAHSQPSREAARRIAPVSGELRLRVLAYLRECGETGATDEEIQTALQMGASTERPRRIELVEAGAVVDSGTTRLTKSGRKATIWTVAQPATEAA
jgi:hypothetical protein